jgi:hypothetical protein
MPTLADYRALWRADFAATAFAAATALLVLLAGWPGPAPPWLAALDLVLLFTAFDALGYKWVLRWGYRVNRIEDARSLTYDEAGEIRPLHPWFRQATAAYRIVQHGIFIPVGLLAAVAFGWRPVAAFAIVWATGGCDLLFYALVRQRLSRDFPWLTGWLWIFPLGFLWRLRRRPLSLAAVAANAALGLGAATALVI